MHKKPVHVMLDLEDGRRIKLSTFGITSGGVMATAVDVSVQRDAEECARALLRDARCGYRIQVKYGIRVRSED